MKTTIEIPDSLFREAREYAARHGITIREVIELGLQKFLGDTTPRRRPFKLKTITTKGEGLACEPDWSVVRSLVYESHGG